MENNFASLKELVSVATDVLNERIVQVQNELIEIAKDLVVTNPQLASSVQLNIHELREAGFLAIVDILHSFIPFIPKASGSELQRMLYGFEDLWAMTQGFINTLPSSTCAEKAVSFDIRHRFNGRVVSVSLCPAWHPIVAQGFNKPLREFQRFHKKIRRTRTQRPKQ